MCALTDMICCVLLSFRRQFSQEYKPEFHDISKKKREEVATSGITLKKINIDKYKEEFTDPVMLRHAPLF